MDQKSEFERYCGNDLKELKKETDPTKRVHLLRRINLHMYAEACKMDRNGFKACRILEDELPEYIRESTPVYEAKMDKMIADMKLDIKPIIVKPKIDVSNFLKSMKCEGRCKNDILLEDFQKMVMIDKSHPPKYVSTVIPSAVPIQPRIFEKTNEKDCSFDSKFHHFKNMSDDSAPSRSHYSINEPSTSGAAGLIPKLPDFHKERCKPSRFSVNTYKSFTSVKRKPDDDICEVDKRPHLLPSNDVESQKKVDFMTGQELLQQQYQNKHGNVNKNQNNHTGPQNNGAMRRTLGGRRTVNSKFVPPVQDDTNQNQLASNSSGNGGYSSSTDQVFDENSFPRLKNIDPKMIEQIKNEIMSNFSPVDWDRIAGLEYPKKIIKEAVVYPILRPDIFSGIRRPPRGILLFGPPGTGKTLIGKCIASQSKSTFFCISASSLTSKWIGEGEKMVRALFAVASCYQPAVIFIDEVDSLLCQRSESEHESSRRLKTEFLVQLDGAATCESERILIVGATNRPQELDEAARRRFVRRLYIPLPDFNARKSILVNLLTEVENELQNNEIDEVARRSDGFSGADMETLTREAAMGPVRCIPLSQIGHFDVNNVRPVDVNDFLTALDSVRASVSPNDLKQYIDWDITYGSGNGK